MTNPYKVLGISPDATDDEVKKAYRNLSRKYHPDANVNNPNKEKAEEMFKLVGEAYNQIMDERKHGASGGFGGSGYGGSSYGGSSYGGYGNPFGGFGGFYGGQSSSNDSINPRLRAAANYINNQHFSEALNVLNEVEEHNAMWYYLSARANYGVGNNVLAMDHAKTAYEMEPSNYSYARFYQALTNGEQWYSNQSSTYQSDCNPICCTNPCLTYLCCASCCGGC